VKPRLLLCPLFQIFIAIIILVACFKLGEIKGRWDIVRQVNKVKVVDNDIHALVRDMRNIK